MSSARLLIQSIKDVTAVRFLESSILDTRLIQQISEQLNELVEARNKKKLLLDFNAVKFLSSSALGLLVTLKKKLDLINGTIVICGMNKELQKVFKITSLDKLFAFADDEESALEVFGVTSAG